MASGTLLQRRSDRARRHLFVMAKEPVAGRVKTRLGAEIGMVKATWFYRHTAQGVVARLQRDPRWQTWLSVEPAAGVHSRMLPNGVNRVPQRGRDLGRRMQNIFRLPIAGSMVIVGTDIPTIRDRDIWRAFRLLGSHDVVFGPAEDGGFWLVGMRRTPRILEAFQDVRWSSSSTLDDCIAGLRRARVAKGTVLSDVDNASDLDLAKHLVGRQVLPTVAGQRLQMNSNPN